MLNRSDIGHQEFSLFVAEAEPRLSRALTGTYGREIGEEATRDALVYAWENWERVSGMENPVGFLFRVGQSRSRRYRRKPLVLPEVRSDELPHIEPALPKALEELSERQRAALLLIHVEGLTERDAARAMGVSRVTVRRHADRALSKLRTFLEVEDG
jgi:RNA polymerase sigma factor (sigma-70 family)